MDQYTSNIECCVSVRVTEAKILICINKKYTQLHSVENFVQSHIFVNLFHIFWSVIMQMTRAISVFGVEIMTNASVFPDIIIYVLMVNEGST